MGYSRASILLFGCALWTACSNEVFLDNPDGAPAADAAGLADAAPADTGARLDAAPSDGAVLLDASIDAGPDAGQPTHRLQISRTGCGALSATVSSTPAGLSCGPVCEASFEEGSAVSLVAQGSVEYPFTGWSGACSGSASCSLSLTANSSVSARFSDLSWYRATGGDATQVYGHLRSASADGHGGMYVSGYYNGAGAFDFGGQGPFGCDPSVLQPAFLAKLDERTGVALWHRCMSSTNAYSRIEARSTVSDPNTGDAITVGSFSYQPNQQTDPPGGVDLGGGHVGCLREGDARDPNGEGMYIARYARADGAHLWSHAYCVKGFETEFQELAIDASGELYAAFSFVSSGLPVSVGGSTLASGMIGNTMIMAKYSLDGAHLWSVARGAATSSGADITLGQIAAGGGGVYVTGAFAGGPVDFGGGPVPPAQDAQDFFLAKYAPSDGHLLWVNSVGPVRVDGSTWAQGFAVKVDHDGNPVVIGAGSGVLDFGLGAYDFMAGATVLAKYDALTGAAIWVRPMVCSVSSGGFFYDLAVDPTANGLLFTGSLSGDCDLGGGHRASFPDSSFFLGRFSSAGDLLWSRVLTSTTVGSDSCAGETTAVDSQGNVFFAGKLGGTVNYCDDSMRTAAYDGIVLGTFHR